MAGGRPQDRVAKVAGLRQMTPKRPRDSDKLWEVEDIVGLVEQWELANYKPEYQFVVRQYAVGKGHSVSVIWRGGEVDSIFGFETEHAALEWIREKSQAWVLEKAR